MELQNLVQSARVKAKEKTFLSREVLEKVAGAATFQAALLELEGTVYRFSQQEVKPAGICSFFDAKRLSLLKEAEELLPEKVYQWFRFRYDLENLRLITNSGWDSLSGKNFTVLGLITGNNLIKAWQEKKNLEIPDLWQPLLKKLIVSPTELTAVSVFKEFFQLSRNLVLSFQNSFLTRYQALEIDFFNLSVFLWKQFSGEVLDWRNLVEGGMVQPGKYQEFSSLMAAFQSNYHSVSPSVNARTWEREYVMAALELLRPVRRLPYGLEVVTAYLFAREIEIKGLQKLLLGKAYGLPAEILQEWLYPVYQ